MATFLVINTDDSGSGSLREAIEAANANPDADTIEFAPWLNGSTIRLESSLEIQTGKLSINGDLDGDGDPDIIISGDATGNGRSADDVGVLINVRAAASLHLYSLRLTDAYAKGNVGAGYSNGQSVNAGIVNAGYLGLSNSILVDFRAVGGDGTGANFNYTRHGGDAFAGVYNSGTAYFSETMLDSMKAFGGSGASFANGLPGGDGGDAQIGIRNFGYAGIYTIGMSGYAYGGNGGEVSGGGGNAGDGGDAGIGLYDAGGSSSFGVNMLFNGAVFKGAGGTATSGTNGSDGLTPDLLSPTLDPVFSAAGSAGNDIVTLGNGLRIATFAGNDFIDNSAGAGRIRAGSGNDTIISGGASPRVAAGYGNDVVRMGAYTGAAYIFAGPGVDLLQLDGLGTNFKLNMAIGESSTNSLFYDFESVIANDEQAFRDTIIGTSGSNLISGRQGIDIIKGGNGDDQLFGGGQNDRLLGGNNDDLLFGGANNDKLKGDNGNDVLFGESGKDQLFGGNDEDKLRGGDGKDLLDGGKGNDQLVGGAKADQFKFGKNYDKDTVTDFTDNVDTLLINDNLWKGTLNKTQILNQFANLKSNGDVVFNFGNGDIFKIKGIGSVDALKNDMTIV